MTGFHLSFTKNVTNCQEKNDCVLLIINNWRNLLKMMIDIFTSMKFKLLLYNGKPQGRNIISNYKSQ